MKGIVLVFLSLSFPLLLCTIQEAKNYTPHKIHATFIWFFVLVSCFQRNLEAQNYMCHEENFQFFEKLLCYPMSLNFTPHKTIYIYIIFLLLFHTTKKIKLCISWHIVFWTCFYCCFFPFFSIVPKKPNYVPHKQHFFGLIFVSW
jgi:hypothetical protein